MEKYYDLDERKFLKDSDIRKESLRRETTDILNNINDYINEELHIESQIDYIRNSVYGEIPNLVNNLNSQWGYNIIESDKLVYELKNTYNDFRKNIKLDDLYTLKNIYIDECSQCVDNNLEDNTERARHYNYEIQITLGNMYSNEDLVKKLNEEHNWKIEIKGV